MIFVFRINPVDRDRQPRAGRRACHRPNFLGAILMLDRLGVFCFGRLLSPDLVSFTHAAEHGGHVRDRVGELLRVELDPALVYRQRLASLDVLGQPGRCGIPDIVVQEACFAEHVVDGQAGEALAGGELDHGEWLPIVFAEFGGLELFPGERESSEGFCGLFVFADILLVPEPRGVGFWRGRLCA